MGVIELILIVVIIGIISSAMISSSATSSRVDWSKGFLVFLGIPFLLLVALGGTYIFLQVGVQKEVALAEADKQAAIQATQREAERARQARRQLNSLQAQGFEVSVNNSIDTSAAAAPVFDDLPAKAEVNHTNYIDHSMPSYMGRATEVISQPAASFTWLIALFIIVPFGVFVWIVSKKNKLAMIGSCWALAAVLLLGGVFTMRTASSVTSVTDRMTPHAPPGPIELPEFEPNLPGSIPVGEEADSGSEMAPLSVRESRYDYSDGTSVTTKTMSKIPNWVEEAKEENIVRPDENEIVITSKRYSSINEAEAELNKIAEMLVTDYIVGIYPEMRETWVDVREIKRLGILEHSCEITWPFQVGEFKDEVYQVAWQLDVTRRIQRELHTNWQKEQLTHRLVIVGGGFGLLTLVFGIGAVVTRGKEQDVA